uniref:Integrase catalytic domain-containing protein n=1 Tax=Salix viminalis TaxID=40686 RepID=A0A6N2KZJ4_SALVM
MTDSVDKLAKIYISEVVRLHGIPVSIVLDRDPRFTSRLWPSIQQALGTRLDMSTTFHPQTDGQLERVIQVLEDLLRACVLEFGGNWEEHLALIEFTYNNSYQATIGMTPYEALYGRRCRTPLCWEEIGDRKLYGVELVQVTMEKVRIIWDHIKAAQDRQKKYADVRRRPLEFCMGDQVYLKVAPWKNILRFGLRGKLTPRFIGPFKILQRVGPVAYKVDLPPQLAKNSTQIPVEVNEDLTLEMRPARILDKGEKELRNKKIPIVRILWRNAQIEEETWEREDEMRKKYPELFKIPGAAGTPCELLLENLRVMMKIDEYVAEILCVNCARKFAVQSGLNHRPDRNNPEVEQVSGLFIVHYGCQVFSWFLGGANVVFEVVAIVFEIVVAVFKVCYIYMLLFNVYVCVAATIAKVIVAVVGVVCWLF